MRQIHIPALKFLRFAKLILIYPIGFECLRIFPVDWLQP
ncbi:Uncharacterized protein ChrSV_3099 [Chromobacterium vaccinii]|nr:Uncharacterized protein ChrSW_3099 [Chromobacterium vaccinii]QND90556.1 Uncharacterized protein ChrSV_3099 [Chromobacterium vaccinii]